MEASADLLFAAFSFAVGVYAIRHGLIKSERSRAYWDMYNIDQQESGKRWSIGAGIFLIFLASFSFLRFLRWLIQ